MNSIFKTGALIVWAAVFCLMAGTCVAPAAASESASINPAPAGAEKWLGPSHRVPRLIKVFGIKHAPVSLLTERLEQVKGPRGKVVVIGNDIYVEDEPGVIAAI